MEAFFHGLPIWLNSVLFVVGIVIIGKGSKILVVSSVSISEKTGIPKIIIGATIVSIATTFPEFTVSLIATIMGYNQIAVGNIIGSCACNIGLVCGLCLLILPAAADKKVLLEKGGFMILGAIVSTAFAFSGILPRWGGVLLLAGFAAYVIHTIKAARDVQNGSSSAKFGMADGLVGDIIRFSAGMACVGLSSFLLVQTGKEIAEWLGVPELIIALTIVSLGTSLPELVTALRAAFMGHSELSVGNVLGANVLNLFWALGACSVIRPLELARQTLILDCPFLIALTLALVLSGIIWKKLGRAHGAALFVIYAAYITVMLTRFI